MSTVRIFYKVTTYGVTHDRYHDFDADSRCDVDAEKKRLKRGFAEHGAEFEFVTWHIVKTEVVEDQT